MPKHRIISAAHKGIPLRIPGIPVILLGAASLLVVDTFAANTTHSAAFPPLALPGPGGYDPAVAALDSCNRGGRNVLGDVYLINTIVSECQKNRTVQARDSGISGGVSTCWSYTSQWTNLELQAQSIEQQAAKTPNGQAAGALMNQAQATLNQAQSILITQAVCTNGLINSDQFAANDRGGGTNGGNGSNGGGETSAPPNNTAVGGGTGPSGPDVHYQAPRPGPAGGIGYQPGANACLPQGPGGYDYCKNGPGAWLPPGCVCGGPPVAQNRASPRWSGYVDSHGDAPSNPTPGGPDGTTLLYGNATQKDPGINGGNQNPNTRLAGTAKSNNPQATQVNPVYTGHIDINGSPKLALAVTAPRGWQNGRVLAGRPKPAVAQTNGVPNYSPFDWAQATIEVTTDANGQRVVTAKVTRLRLAGSGAGTEANKASDYQLYERGTDSWQRQPVPFVRVPLAPASTDR